LAHEDKQGDNGETIGAENVINVFGQKIEGCTPRDKVAEAEETY
jgi:hypothetical protein